MFRKISLAAVAALALTAAAVAPASAGGGHGGHGGGHGMHGGGHWGGGHGGYWGHRHGRFYGSSFYVGGSCYKTVFTEFGPRRINVCARVL
jgi:hypothetical protein